MTMQEQRFREVVEGMERALNRYDFAHPAIHKILDANNVGAWRHSHDEEGATLLHHAARYGLASAMDWLLQQAECDRNAKDRQGLTALDYAAAANQTEAVRLLLLDPHLDELADPLNYRNYGAGRKTTLDRAIEADAEVPAQLLRNHARKRTLAELDKSDPQAGLADAHGRTALHWAVRRRKAGRVERLLETGANPRQLDRHGESPADVALRMRWRTGISIFERHETKLADVPQDASGATMAEAEQEP